MTLLPGDESWISHRTIGSKQSKMLWYSEGANPPTVFRRNQCDQKNMFVIFFRTTEPELIHMLERDD